MDSERFGRALGFVGDLSGDGTTVLAVGAGAGVDGGAIWLLKFQTAAQSIMLGDCNQDGVVSFLDIAPFIDYLSSSMLLAEADCNQDGIVSFLDIAPFIAILTAT